MKICLHKFMELVRIDYSDPDNDVFWSLEISNGRILMGKDKKRNKSRDMKHEIEKAKKAAGERVPSDASSEPTPVLNSVPQFPWEDVPGDNSSEPTPIFNRELINVLMPDPEHVPSDDSSEPTPVLNSVPQFPWEDVPGDNSSEQSWLLTPEMDSPWNGAFSYADFELDPSW